MAKDLKAHNFFGFDATVVADSLGIFGDRVTTMVITLPRIILAEFNTHRMFARNSASSRAIPFKKMVERVESNPFIPFLWQKDHVGMQGTQYYTEHEVEYLEIADVWLRARDQAVFHAKELGTIEDSGIGITKQLCNRLLEPFLWHTIICTSSEWENFFSLRCPQFTINVDENKEVFRSRKEANAYMDWMEEDTSLLDWFIKYNKSQADIHIQLAAEAMWDAMNESTPKQLKGDEWHIPFADEIDDLRLEDILEQRPFQKGEHRSEVKDQFKIKIAVATCARISFGNISPADADYEKDIALYERLASSRHSSPFEHVLKCMHEGEYGTYFKGQAYSFTDYPPYSIAFKEDGDYLDGRGWCDNFRGFISQRHLEQV